MPDSSEKTKAVRPPAVAGSFYPADPAELDRELARLLKAATVTSLPQPLQILIVPHAGLTYSGRTAAAGFHLIEYKNYSKIILLGASHHYFFPHAAVGAARNWQTPLGTVAVDTALAAALSDNGQNIINDPSPHNPEHGLEMELIFLQKVLPHFQIVPILVSQPSEPLVEALAQKIAVNRDAQTLLVVSTDLSHYPSHETANRVDGQTVAAILTGQKEKLETAVAQLESQNYPGLDTAACGFQALRVALRVGELLQVRWQKIHYENSGDISGEKDRVVGYAAVAGYGGTFQMSPADSSTRRVDGVNPTGFPRRDTSAADPAAAVLLDPTAQQEALALARQTLESYLETGQIPADTPQNAALNQPLGAFTTLRQNDQLRGCIGEFEPQKPLYHVIQSTAVAAATQDPRFPPVTAAELSQLTIELSVLTPKKKINHWQEIQLGTHGVVVQKGSRAGTFLPQVAAETGWNLEQLLGQLCTQKAGLPPDCYQDPTVTLYTFEAQVFRD